MPENALNSPPTLAEVLYKPLVQCSGVHYSNMYYSQVSVVFSVIVADYCCMSDVKNRIASLLNAGMMDVARQECLSACEQSPQDAELWFLLSAICGQVKDFPAAEQYCQKAISINSTVPSAYYNLAVAQRAQGKTDQALATLQHAMQLQENFVAAIFEVGNIFLEKGDVQQAIEYYNKTLGLAPNIYQAYTGLAYAYDALGQTEAAIEACQKSLSFEAGQADVTFRLALLYDKQGNLSHAKQLYQKARELGYAEAELYVNLGSILEREHQADQAEANYRQALNLAPDSVEALSNLALLLLNQKIHDQALELIEKASAIRPEDNQLMYNRAKIHAAAGHYSEAEALYQQLLAKQPDFAEAAVNLGNLYLLKGEPELALESYSQACDQDPDYQEACSNRLMSMNYIAGMSAPAVFDQHIQWANRLEGKTQRRTLATDAGMNTPEKGGKVPRVAYLSPDFRHHSVAYFLEGILKYSDTSKVQTYCYADVARPDEVTARLQSCVENWCDVSGMDDEALATRIQADKIDILIELCGHVSGGRMKVMAMKPAALQISYLGYPHTTGLSSIDYRIVDSVTDPVEHHGLLREKALTLKPCFLSYTPYANSPEVKALPAAENTYITFGSFNNLAKVTPEVIKIWSQLLKRVNNARLCLKARQFSDEQIRQDWENRFAEQGIGAERLLLLGHAASTESHLDSYNQIDIALDTFPYNGTTTTFEALWMGVPVVCLKGDRHASRVELRLCMH